MTSPPEKFDKSHWKRVNEALDQALELDGSDRETFLQTLAEDDAALTNEVRRLIERAAATTSVLPAIDPAPRRGLTTELATVFKTGAPMAERGFDDLLHRALRAERAMQKSQHYAGEMCGAWKLQNVIGTGGMGEVWLAERADGLFEAKAAVKFLRPDGDASRFEARFSQERALLARLNHPGIARLLDAGRQFGMPFLVLEYVEGSNLLDYATVHAPTVEQRLELLRQIAEAIAYAHSQLVVHRDLKPSNVLVTREGKVKLLDFGVAGLLANDDFHQTTESPATRVAGRGLTPEYAAPEQIAGDATGVGSDVYSLGALSFHLLTGRRAFVPETPGRAAIEHAILHTDAPRVSDAVRRPPPAHANDNIPPPSDVARLDADIDAIVASMLRRDPNARYRTAGEVLADLHRFSARRPIAARAQDRAYRSRLWLRRNWLPTTLASSLAVALIVGFGVALWQAERAREEADRASKTADYLVELLSGADPDLHGGNWPSALDLIERAERDLGTRFGDEPNVEQKISQSVATTLRRLSRFQEALPIAKRSYALSESLYGENAESTRVAGALLADILYWVDKNDEALTVLEKILGDTPPKPIPDWWREAFLLRTNVVSEFRRFPEAYAGHDKYLDYIRGHKYEVWLEAESETDRALTLMTEGRHKESLAIHRKYRNILANPPEGVAKRISLSNLNNGYVMALYMGEADGLEEAFKKNSSEWDRLAGRNNHHSVQALGRRGLYYHHYDRPHDAIAMYREQLDRIQAQKNPDRSREIFVQIDILEVQTKFFLLPPDEILSEASSLEKAIAARPEIDQSARDRYLQRIAMVRVTHGDASALAKSVATLPPSIDLKDQRPDRAATRWTASATLLAATGKFGEACDALNFAADRVGEKNRVLVAAPLYMRRALFCMLAGSKDTERHLRIARASLPDTLPKTHRLWRVLDHLDRVARAKNGEEIARSQRQLAMELNSPGVANVSPALIGLVF
jgi:eukaryotic-like serine/threonine-protein kinase